MARANELGQNGLHALEIGELVPYVPKLVFSEAARIVAVRSVFQFQEVRDFVEAETQPLGRFDNPRPGDVSLTIAANAAIRLLRLEQQSLALIEPDRLHIDAGRLREGADSQAFVTVFHTTWTGTHFVDAMNWLSRVIHGRSAGRLLRPRRRPAVGNSTLIMTRVPPCIYSRRASAARIHSDSYNPTTNVGVQCCSTRGTP